jgi:signal recognition particle receptor subunit beta
MSSINEKSKEISYKIVYYGPGVGGKTTNMQCICRKESYQTNNKILSSLLYRDDRQIFFSFLSSEMYPINGFRLRYHLYTVPGANFYYASRQLIVENADAIIFVADSQAERKSSNIESLKNLQDHLKTQGNDIGTMPYALQLNKRDLPNALPIDELKKDLVYKNEPVFEAIAYKEIGVYETFNSICMQIWQHIKM